MNDDLISRRVVLDFIDSMRELVENGRRMIRQADTLPSAQPKTVCIAKVTLSDEQIQEAVEKVKNEVVQVLPTAESEIIRCKDCKYYYFADNRVPSEQSWVCDAWGVDQTERMGYCFKAERRTDE